MTVDEPVEPIAVIGLACRLPGARDVDEFWRNLAAGVESISFFTPDELRSAGVDEAHIGNSDYVAAAPVMPDADLFDADLFSFTETEARLSAPQTRIFLEMCHAALENAGYDPFGTTESVGVFGTTGDNGYLLQSIRNEPSLVEGAANVQLFTLNHADYLATLTSHRLDLRGPSMTVLTACSSSLVAVHLAAQALRAGDCDVALAGGSVVEVPTGHGYLWTPGSVHSADGHCRPFDAAGSGTIFGSGAGVVVLRRLDDALAAGDDIRAVIRGTAVNNDGADKVSFSAPGVSGQTAAVAEAMALAGVCPENVGYVEAHATGTALGDPIEVRALAAAYRALSEAPLTPGRTAIGSVKSNIGHMNAVAGVAGLIKTVLMLEHQAIVPSIGITSPNPALDLDRTPFALATSLRPWPRDARAPRVAGVNSLGVGGTNVHVLLTEGPAAPVREVDHRPRIVPWSARTEEAVEQLRDDLAAHFRAQEVPLFADAVATLQHGRTAHPVRAAAVCRPDDAAAVLADRALVVTGRVRENATTVYLFPGQGAHRLRMAAELYGAVRSFSIAMDECIELFEQNGVALHDLWLGEEPTDDTGVVQPLLFAVEYALAAMWTEWGVTPDAVAGHSVGELTAAAVAGVFTLPDAVRLVVARAEAMVAHPVPGGLLALRADVAEIGALPGGVAVAAVNGPDQVVLSGPLDALAVLAGKSPGSRALAVSHAFHHPGWHEAAEAFRVAVASVEAKPPLIPLYSGHTGALVRSEEAMTPEFWSMQLTRPVLFGSVLEAVLAEPGRLLLEVGPGSTLTGLAARLPRARGVPVVASVPGRSDAVHEVLRAAAQLWVHGAPLDWDATGQHAPVRKLPVPGYPYQRKRYWVDPDPSRPRESATKNEDSAAMTTSTTRTEPGVTPFSTIEWTRSRRLLARPTGARGMALVLLPAEPRWALDTVLAVERAGHRTIRVRPGDGYAEAGGEFRVRLDHPDDLATVFRRLAERGITPDALVHAVAFGPVTPLAVGLDERLDAAFTSLLALAREAERHSARSFTVLISGSVDVSGDEPVDPANAVVHGVVRTLLAEVPRLRGGVIDVGDRVASVDLAAEFGLADPPDVVALRGSRRWVPVETPLHVPEVDREVLRERGVYLITGGFGGLGLELARHLAGTGLRPRLVLLGRRDPHADDRVRDRITELDELGAEVTAIRCDVADRQAVLDAVTRVTAAHGQVNGLFHLAGVPGDRMIPFREPADAATVLAPKTIGTVNLLEAFGNGAPLDFTVFFSSRAAIDGLVGGADYAAANAFLDASAQVAGGRVLSVGWPVWLGEGMVDHTGPDVTGLASVIAGLDDAGEAGTVTWDGELGAACQWVLDEHRVGRVPLLPGTGYLDLVTTVFTEKLGDRTGAVELTDVVFRALFADERTRPARIEFVPARVGYDFTVSSEVDGSWTTHATGRIANVAAEAPVVDIAALRARFEIAASGSTGVVDLPFTLGPRWRNVRQVWHAGDERLARLELKAAFAGDLLTHRLHPAILDTGTAAVRDSGEGDFVPFLVRRLVRYEDLRASVFSHVRRSSSGEGTAVGDVEFVADDGTVLVAVEGYTMRKVDFGEGWDAAKVATSAAEPRPTVRPSSGVEPEVALGLLMRLLGADVPAHVLVRPFVSGEPTELDHEPVLREPVAVAEPASASVPPAPTQPAGATNEDRLRRLWAQALGAPPASVDDDFFDMGGDSLAAVELMARIRSAFGIELSIGLLLDLRTFGGLLGVVEARLGQV